MTRSDAAPLHRRDLEAVVARACFPERDDERAIGRIGLEIERFPIAVGSTGAPSGRLALADPHPSSASILTDRAGQGLQAQDEQRGLPSFAIDGGGVITFEPGGQLEHVTLAYDTAAGALDEADSVGGLLAEAFDEAGAVVASTGVDVWHEPGTLPLQLGSYRYPAMDAYFAARSPFGRLMMRDTCSIQVNLDLGPPARRPQRWLLANLIAPVLTATFANSPSPRHVSHRAHAWQQLDPTRTGFPARLVDASTDDPVAQLCEAALAADVLLVRTGPSQGVPGAPGWTFGDWLGHSHPEHGSPSAADLEYHLSTLFHEVRPRGRLEFRGIDAIPQRWRGVPVTLLAGALEDARAADQLTALLERRRRELPALWRRAATSGVADPALCALAVEVWSYALEGARRLPSGYVGGRHLDDAERFLDAFTMRGRCPADELSERLSDGRASALAWASEPVPERSRRGR